MTNIGWQETEDGILTLGLPAKLVEVSRLAHQQFLAAHGVHSWKGIVKQIPGTRHILVFSGAPHNDEQPSYTLTDAEHLMKRVTEILTLHQEQYVQRLSPAGSR